MFGLFGCLSSDFRVVTYFDAGGIMKSLPKTLQSHFRTLQTLVYVILPPSTENLSCCRLKV